jgi:hypothetical protein
MQFTPETRQLAWDVAQHWGVIRTKETRESMFVIMKRRANAMMSFADPGNQWNAYASGCITSLISEIKEKTR